MELNFIEIFSQKNKAEYLFLLDQLPIPLLILEQDLTIVYSNIAACKLYGYEEGSITGNFKELLAVQTKTASAKEIFEIEQHKTFKNKSIYVGVKYNICSFSEGTCYLLQINDVSEVKKHQLKIKNLLTETHSLTEAILKTQSELVQQENRLNSLIHSQLNFLIRTDPKGYITFANKSFTTLFDKNSTKSKAQNIAQFVIEEDIQIWNAAIETCLKAPGKLATASLRMLLPDHSIVFVEWELYSISLSKNEVPEIQAVGNNVTEKKAVEANLQRTLTLFTSVFNQSSDAIFLVSNDTSQILDCNDTALSMFEFDDKKDIIGKIGYEFEVKSPNHDSLDSLNEKLKNSALNREVQYRSNKGKHFWGNMIAKTIPFLNDQITMVKVSDITEKKIKEKEINNLLKDTLVFNQQLKAKNEELNKLNSELDSFVYRVSHDLRAPIASTLGLVSIAKIEKEHEKVMEYLDLMDQSLNKLDDFIQDILDYSRNNRTDVENEELDIKKLIDSIITQNKFAIEERNISIENEILEGTIIKSDINRLSVVMSNLISNSIRYSNSYVDSSFIKINITKLDTEYIISVIDNGIGIPDKYQYDIFDMFFRVSNTGRNGSGIGLYIVKENLLKLNGNISVYSIEGKGSTFNINLPIN